MDETRRGAAREFFDEKRREVRTRGLMAYPIESEAETNEIRAFERLFDVLAGPIPIRHPHFDLKLDLDPLLGPRVAYLIAIGDYELGDLELIERYVRTGDRVIELGGGAGLTAALNAKQTGNEVVVVEPDDRLFPIIRRQVELNGGTVRFEHGAVSAQAIRGETDFFVDAEIWFSSTHREVKSHGERMRRKVSVPVVDLDALLSTHRPTVAMIDIEGAELELFDRPLAQKPRLIVVEIHTPHFGERAGAQLVQKICDQGYALIDLYGWTYVFEARASQ